MSCFSSVRSNPLRSAIVPQIPRRLAIQYNGPPFFPDPHIQTSTKAETAPGRVVRPGLLNHHHAHPDISSSHIVLPHTKPHAQRVRQDLRFASPSCSTISSVILGRPRSATARTLLPCVYHQHARARALALNCKAALSTSPGCRMMLRSMLLVRGITLGAPVVVTCGRL